MVGANSWKKVCVDHEHFVIIAPKHCVMVFVFVKSC